MSANIIVIDTVHQEIHGRNFWDYQERFEDVANNGTITFQMLAVNKHMHLVVTIDAEGKSHFDTYQGTTYTANGTEQDTFNRYIDDAPEAQGKIYLTPTVDVLGTARFRKLILGGTGPQSTGASGQSSRIESILAPGQNLYLVITNVSGQAKDYGVTIEWYEEDY